MSSVTREQIIGLLKVAACPASCDNGVVVRDLLHGEIEQCQFCFERLRAIADLQAAEPVAWIEIRDCDCEECEWEQDVTTDPLWAKHYPDKWTPLFTLPCPPAKAQVPEGWKLVPVEPTDHMSDVGMVSAGIDITENDARHVYSAMLDASPQPAPTAVPEGWHISRTEGGNIIVQKSHVAGFVASEQGGGIAESTLYYLADDLLNAPLNPEHSGDSNEMPGWEPIETAPMDGTHIQLYRPKTQFIGYYGGANSGWRHNAPGLDAVWPLPTHWMPLLNPPQQEGAER